MSGKRQNNQNDADGALTWPFIGAAVVVVIAAISVLLLLSGDPTSRPVGASVASQSTSSLSSSSLSSAELLPVNLPGSILSTGGPLRGFLYTGPNEAVPDNRDQKTMYWWDGVPESMQAKTTRLDQFSNIRLADYTGPEACQSCHKENFDHWMQHPHHKMNMEAIEGNVLGDFSGGPNARIEYRGGVATFYQQDGQYRMRLERDGIARTFHVTRTIGSRFFQYYAGILIDGPTPATVLPEWPAEKLREVDHTLPFGYWLDEQEWVPAVHVGDRGEPPDSQREDPFIYPSRDPYTARCSSCHTTLPAGDWMLRYYSARRLEEYTPHFISFHASDFLADEFPEILPTREQAKVTPTETAYQMLYHTLERVPWKRNTVTLGISCEACHFGCQQHVDDTKQLPKFFPAGEEVLVYDHKQLGDELWDRNSANINFVCARCHSGERPQFAHGMSTWNSTESSDAFRGHCYDLEKAQHAGMQQLTCVHCHNPHQKIGKTWTRTPAQDDATCLACHQQFEAPDQLQAHTHHPVNHEGSRCMNCHMPKVNEGLQDVVRTHTIYNPTEPRMIESNQANACNLCHVDQPINWTLRYLNEWYGKSYSETKIASNYPLREGSAAIGWLHSEHEPTRMVAAGALADADAQWSIPDLIRMLDDPFMLNRQFTQRWLEEMLEVDLAQFGYRHYQEAAERAEPIRRIWQEFGNVKAASR